MRIISMVDKKECCGCTACYNICPVNAIVMENIRGFVYPVIDEKKCIQCGRCVAVCCCFGIKRDYAKLPEEAYLYSSADSQILWETTSGGFFTQLAADIILEGGTVFSPAFEEDWNVRFIGIDSLDMVHRIRGSKYVEAALGTVFQQAEEKLIQGEKVLFSGTPCQVSGLKSYLNVRGIDYKSNLILTAVVCHGNVSSDYWRRFLEYIGNGKKIKAINFREKTYGYHTSTLAVKFSDGSSYHETYDNGYYLPAFFSGYSIRENCFSCKFRGEAADADFIIGDYWKAAGNSQGRTLIFAYSGYARAYMNKLKESASDLIQMVSAREAVLWNGNGDSSQSCLFASPKQNERREAFMEDAFRLDLTQIRKKYFPVTIKKRIKAVLRPVRYRIKRSLKRNGTK